MKTKKMTLNELRNIVKESIGGKRSIINLIFTDEQLSEIEAISDKYAHTFFDRSDTYTRKMNEVITNILHRDEGVTLNDSELNIVSRLVHFYLK